MKKILFIIIIIGILTVFIGYFIYSWKGDSNKYEISHNDHTLLIRHGETEGVFNIPLEDFMENAGFGKDDWFIQYVALGSSSEKVFVAISISSRSSNRVTPYVLVEATFDQKFRIIEGIDELANITDIALSPRENYLAYASALGLNACQINTNIKIIKINLGDLRPTEVNPGPDVVDFLKMEHKTVSDQEAVSEIINKPRWRDSGNLLFNREFDHCAEGRISKVETWQYNIETENYTLISSNES